MMTAPKVTPSIHRPNVAPAPHLTSKGQCSECGVIAVVAAGGDMKVCPQCFGVLWRRDYKEDERRRKEQAAIDAARVFAQTKTREERAQLQAAKRDEGQEAGKTSDDEIKP